MAKKKTPGDAPILDAARTAAKLLDTLTAEYLLVIKDGSYYGKKIEEAPSWKLVIDQGREEHVAMVRASLERLSDLENKIAIFRSKLDAPIYHPQDLQGLLPQAK